MTRGILRGAAWLLLGAVAVVSNGPWLAAQERLLTAEPPVDLSGGNSTSGGEIRAVPPDPQEGSAEPSGGLGVFAPYDLVYPPATHSTGDLVADSGASSGAVCGGGCYHDRCGCNPQLFPWIRGPGVNDQWCVGPHLAVEVEGLILRRDDADLARVIGAVGLGADLVDQFDYAAGARIGVTGYNDAGFGMQVVYEGVNDFDATATFPQAGSNRSFTYQSNLNSIEVNFLSRDSNVWKLFGGFRYVEVDEDFNDFTTVDKPLPAPADPPAAGVAFVDFGDSYLIENRLFGFQLGAFRDGWQLNQWLSVESFCNGGIYMNDFKREEVARQVTTVVNGDDLATPNVNEFSQDVTSVDTIVRRDFSNLAFVGEVGVAAVLRINRSTALRSGYQVLVVDGVGEGLDAFFVSGFNRSTLLYHGLQIGLEYRR
jgi:hypothetical protein